ncbi:uncharacterized protein V6R79_009588 [Siganus canaliculatus]
MSKVSICVFLSSSLSEIPDHFRTPCSRPTAEAAAPYLESDRQLEGDTRAEARADTAGSSSVTGSGTGNQNQDQDQFQGQDGADPVDKETASTLAVSRCLFRGNRSFFRLFEAENEMKMSRSPSTGEFRFVSPDSREHERQPRNPPGGLDEFGYGFFYIYI